MRRRAPSEELKKVGESMTFDECDDVLACLTDLLEEKGLNGTTLCHMLRWKFRQLQRQENVRVRQERLVIDGHYR